MDNDLVHRLQEEADHRKYDESEELVALLWEAAAAVSMSPPGVGTWPIAKLVVNEAGAITASFYTPGLPAGEYNVWLPGMPAAPGETSARPDPLVSALRGLLASLHRQPNEHELRAAAHEFTVLADRAAAEAHRAAGTLGPQDC